MLDLLMYFQDAKDYVNKYGWDAFISKVDKEYTKSRNREQLLELYGCSTAWIDNPKYICKLRGKYGDLIIGWVGIHDVI